jgi:hypothetical protein
LKRTTRDVEKIGDAITRIGKDIPLVEKIAVETKNYKALVTKKVETVNRISSHLSLLYLCSMLFLGVAINIVSGYVNLIPDATVRNCISLLFLMVGIILGYWQSKYSPNGRFH